MAAKITGKQRAARKRNIKKAQQAKKNSLLKTASRLGVKGRKKGGGFTSSQKKNLLSAEKFSRKNRSKHP